VRVAAEQKAIEEAKDQGADLDLIKAKFKGV